jgi:hypothetical protein
VHIPKVLYHWRKSPASAAGSVLAKPWANDAGRRALGDFVRRNRLDADVLADAAPGRYRVRRRVTANASVSVIVGAFAPLTSSGDAARLVAELEQRGYVSEITVVLSRDGDAHQLPGLRNARVVVAPSGHHALAEVNRLARGANGRHLLFIAPGLSPMTPEWMEALIEHSSVSDVAAVGAKLLDPEGRIRHIGLVMGLRGIAGSPFAGFPGTVEGYVSNAMGMRNYSAVSGACLMTRRDVFEALDGFDLRAGPIHAAVDYCLRARRGGRRIVFTPYACLRETGSSPAVEDPVGDAYMREAWADVIRDDPFYNPNLSRDFFDCRPRA